LTLEVGISNTNTWDSHNVAHYAEPPHNPSKLIRTKTIGTAKSVDPKRPIADSKTKVRRMNDCKIAGRGRSFLGSAGKPIEIEDRDRNTKVW
jgi:hypothetical protein